MQGSLDAEDTPSLATTDVTSQSDQSILSRDWTVTCSDVSYATGDGKLLLEEATAVIPGSSCCALVGPAVADKGCLLRLLGGAARGGYFSGRVAFGGRPYADAALVSSFCEAPDAPQPEAASLLGGSSPEAALTPAERVALAAALRFGPAADGDHRWSPIAHALGLDDASRQQAAARAAAAQRRQRNARYVGRMAGHGGAAAEAAVTRVAVAAVHGPPIVCVEDPFRGLDRAGCLQVARALAALTARGHTVIASLDAAGMGDAAFEAAFSRAAVLRDGRVLFCGEARVAARHCQQVLGPEPEILRSVHAVPAALARCGRLDAMERVSADAGLAEFCEARYARTPAARRAEQEAAHAEPADDDRGALRELAPPQVSAVFKARILLGRDLARGGRPLGAGYVDRHLGTLAVALLWGVLFWDAESKGASILAAYDLRSCAFAGGQIVLGAYLAAAPALCRRHGEFERERRARRTQWPEHLAARTLALVLDALVVGFAPCVVYLAAGYPRRFSALGYVYGLGVALALCSASTVEALAAWAHSPPAPDQRGGGGGAFATERFAAARADRAACGAFGVLVSIALLCTGFGIELEKFGPWNPFRISAVFNPLRWFVQGTVLRVARGGGCCPGSINPTFGGYKRYNAGDSFHALGALFAGARLASYFFLSRRPPQVRHVDGRKLRAWARTAPGVAEKKKAQKEKKASGKGAVAVPPPAPPAPARPLERPASDAAFKNAVEARGAGGVAAEGLSLAARAEPRGDWAPLVVGVSVAARPGEALLLGGADAQAPRCLLRALAGRDPRRHAREKVAIAQGIVTATGERSSRPSRAAWVPATDAHLDAWAALDAREVCAFALALTGGRGGARWVGCCLDVAGVSEEARGRPLRAAAGEAPGLHRRRVALAVELLRAPALLFCDDVGGGARAPAAGARDALAPRDAAALAQAYARCARAGGCCVVATAHGAGRAAALAFDRVVLLAPRAAGGHGVAYAATPAALLAGVGAAVGAAGADSARLARDATLAPLDVAATLPRLSGVARAPAAREPAWGAAAAVAPRGDRRKVLELSALRQAAVLLRREKAALQEDRGRLGAAVGAPLCNALLLAIAFWGQGRRQNGRADPIVATWLNYCLLASFAAPAALALTADAAAARAFAHESRAGLVGAPAFFAAQLAAALPTIVLNAVMCVAVAYGCAGLRTGAGPFGLAALCCGLAGLAARALALAAVWAHAGAAAADAPAISAPEAQRLRARAVARAGDVAALFSLVVLMYAGFFRFPKDLSGPWHEASTADYGRYLLTSMSLPQIHGASVPHRYEYNRPELADGAALDDAGPGDDSVGPPFYLDQGRPARAFFGHPKGVNSFDTLVRAVLYGPVPLAFLAALALVRLLHATRDR